MQMKEAPSTLFVQGQQSPFPGMIRLHMWFYMKKLRELMCCHFYVLSIHFRTGQNNNTKKNMSHMDVKGLDYSITN